jgi:hypothetical protein
MENKTSKFLGFFKDIPGWAKGIILILIVLLIVWIVYKFYKTVGFKTEGERDIQRDLDKDEDVLIKAGQKPTFPRTWYRGAADKLYACGAGQTTFTGTDESCIYSVFVQLKNDMDILLLTEAFGSRRKGFSFNEANLGGWITDEMNSGERSALNNILARRQIKYRF